MNWLGAFLLVGATYFLGTRLSDTEREKIKTLDSLIAFLTYMRRKMVYERTPLYEIFSHFSEPYLEKCRFLPCLRSHCRDLGILWSKAADRLDVDSQMSGELKYFGESLGRLPLDEQIKRLDSCLEALKNERDTLQKQLPSKRKSIKTVCLLFGLMTAIILL